jgi:hypothetical protein
MDGKMKHKRKHPLEMLSESSEHEQDLDPEGEY